VRRRIRSPLSHEGADGDYHTDKISQYKRHVASKHASTSTTAE